MSSRLRSALHVMGKSGPMPDCSALLIGQPLALTYYTSKGVALNLNPDKVKSVLAGVDWGYTNPGVITVWAVDNDLRLYLIHEVYQTHRLIDWWTEKAKSLHGMYRMKHFLCDPSEPAYIKQFRNAGLPAKAAQNDLSLGIQMVQQRLGIQEDGRPRLYLSENACEEYDSNLYREYPGDLHPCCTAHEFPVYAWPENRDGKASKEAPLDANNHGLDTVRYVVLELDKPSGIFKPEIW